MGYIQRNLDAVSILVSHAYIRGKSSKFADTLVGLSDVFRIMIDSGAFTDFSKKNKKIKGGDVDAVGEITIQEYMDYCRRFYKHMYQYIALDIIADPVGTRKNVEQMFTAGLTPMPVFTRGASWKDLEDYVQMNENICYGGITKFSKNKVFAANLVYGYDVSKQKAKFHLLGYARYPQVLSLPIKSCDASSHSVGQVYGHLAVFDEYTGVTYYHKQIFTNRLKYPGILAEYGITKKDLEDPDSWTGWRGIISMATLYAHVKQQLYIYEKTGQYYFLAIPSATHMNSIIALHLTLKANGSYDYRDTLEVANDLHAGYKISSDEYVKRVKSYV